MDLERTTLPEEAIMKETLFSLGGSIIETSAPSDRPEECVLLEDAPARKTSGSPQRIQRMESIAEESNNKDYGITVMQLLPDFDGSLDDMMLAEPVSYTQEELSNLHTEVTVDESLGCHKLTESGLPVDGFIPPCVLQKIVDSSDSIDSLDPDKAKKAFRPCLNSALGTSLSLTSEGFIQMNDYKISFDSMGGGRLSEVRVAFSEKDQQQYAVKILNKKKLENYNLLLKHSRNPLEEAYREIDILRRLTHPNIIDLIEVIDNPEDDNIYIVMELLDQALLDIPTESPFSEEEAKKFFLEILCGVEHLHNNHVVHRDLKPDNMLLSKQGVVKIADFGFCEELVYDTNSEDSSESECESPAEVSAVHGTPAFTPPECLLRRKKPVGGRSLDMWSLGVTLYSLVVGDVPFKGETMPLLFQSILHDSVVFPPQIVLSDRLVDLISRLLDKNPKTRICMEQVKAHLWLQTDPPKADVPEADPCKGRLEGLSSVVTGVADLHLR